MLGGAVGHNLKKNHRPRTITAKVGVPEQKFNLKRIFRKAPPSVVSGYDKQSINLNKVVATFEKHIFLSQTDLTRTGIISNSYNEMLVTISIQSLW
jgi:hypothetical protein